jgi:hypothetical protein
MTVESPARGSGRPTQTRLLTLALLLVAIGTFVYHARIYWAWTEDDAYISFRYAQNLAGGHGLVFNAGERVEGYSNFSWVMLATAALRAGLDPVVVGKVVGIVSGALAVPLAWVLARRLVAGVGFAALLAPLYLALSPVLVQHSVTALETSFFALLVVVALLLAPPPGGFLRRSTLVATLVVQSLTRPEGPLLAALLLALRAGRAVARREAVRAAVIDAAAYLVLFGAYFAWRWSYFGAPFPNTYYAKAQGGLHGVIDGAQYTLDFLRDAGGPLFAGLALVPLVVGGRRPAHGMALAVVAAYGGFVLVSGGDWMFHYRFFAHVLPVLAALVAAGIDRVLALPRPGTARAVVLYAGVALVLLATHMSLGNTELRTARLVLPALERHNYLSQNYEELGRWFRENTPPEAKIAISDVGAVGYYSERRILDMFGLIDPHIARLRGRMHYKADPKYVLGRDPDYIVLVSLNDEGQGYSFQRIPDYAMNAQADFHARYALIRTEPQYWQDEFVLVYQRRP